MLRNFPLTLLLVACPLPAQACQPPIPGPAVTKAEIAREAIRQIRQSDAIIDAKVVRWLDGEVILRALRVWKGPKQRFWKVWDSRCGTAFPLPGEKVRVLLKRDGTRNWYPFDPSLGGRLTYSVLLERAIDSRLGSARPKDFVSIDDAVPPPPPATR